MYAVIMTGGKQYFVSEGQTLRIEKLDRDVGDSVTFDVVLMVVNGSDVKVGAPHMTGSSVEAEVVAQGRGKKIDVLKFKRRKGYLKRQGHRQDFTEVKIKNIVLSSTAAA